MRPKLITGVPEQEKGSFHDTESRRLFDNHQATDQSFKTLKERFLMINEWQNYCGKKSVDFKLFDSFGDHITRPPQENDCIRIDIPGPGNPESKGYEWVKIIEISNQFLNVGEIENLIMVCVPATIPNQDKNNHIAHFYSEKSSSTFKIARGSKYIKLGIYGRNETPNMNTNFAGKMRNLMIAVGVMFGMSKFQWKVFADEMLKF